MVGVSDYSEEVGQFRKDSETETEAEAETESAHFALGSGGWLPNMLHWVSDGDATRSGVDGFSTCA